MRRDDARGEHDFLKLRNPIALRDPEKPLPASDVSESILSAEYAIFKLVRHRPIERQSQGATIGCRHGTLLPDVTQRFAIRISLYPGFNKVDSKGKCTSFLGSGSASSEMGGNNSPAKRHWGGPPPPH